MAQNESDLQICYAEYFVGNSKVRAWLWAVRAGLDIRYEIELEQAGERQRCEVGARARQARELFLRVVWGGVSLCTLADIVEDRSGTLF